MERAYWIFLSDDGDRFQHVPFRINFTFHWSFIIIKFLNSNKKNQRKNIKKNSIFYNFSIFFGKKFLGQPLSIFFRFFLSLKRWIILMK